MFLPSLKLFTIVFRMLHFCKCHIHSIPEDGARAIFSLLNCLVILCKVVYNKSVNCSYPKMYFFTVAYLVPVILLQQLIILYMSEMHFI